MATGATGGGAGGGHGLLAWIAGGAVVVGIAVGALYYAGMIGPSVNDLPAEVTAVAPNDVQPDIQPDTTDTSDSPPNVDGGVQPDATAEATPQAADDAPQDNTPVVQPEPDQSDPSLSAPGFDVVRVDPDGNTVIAGTGPAGAQITIFLDGEQQVSTTADRSGAFVSLLSIAPSQTARILSMTAELDGQTRQSDDQIILAPTPAVDPQPVEDVQVAAVAPAAGDVASNSQEPVEGSDESSVSAAPVDPVSEPVQPNATAETASVPSAENVQTAAADPAPTGEAAENDPVADAKPDGVADTTEDTTESERLESEPVPVTTVQAEPAQSEPSGPVATPTEITPPQTAATVPSATSDLPPVKAKPAQPDNADTEVASVTTPPTVAPTKEPDTAGGTPSEVIAQSDPVVAPDTPAAQATETSTETPPTDRNIETAALAEPVIEPPVTTLQPPAPASQEAASTAVPELAPAPAQPLAPGQPALLSRPQSPALITILRAGPDGVEVLQSGASVPRTPDKIALDVISYSEAGEIQLSGRAQVRSVVRVYLDNKPVGDLVADDTGRWSGEIEGIAPGIYTLRLDELGQAGVVLSRIETPFKRESPEVLRPPQDPNQVAANDTADGGPVPSIRAVTVQQGDTLWAISRERYGDGVLFVRVFEANRGDIRDPDLIYPGQVFTLPE